MFLYRLSQTANKGYDTYDSCVVVAPNAEFARTIHPCGVLDPHCYQVDTWTSTDNVVVEMIGIADPKYKNPQVICASYNAG